MSDKPSKQELLQQGLEWFRLNKHPLIELCQKGILEQARKKGRNLAPEIALQAATAAINNNIQRLAGIALDPAQMKTNFYQGFTQSGISVDFMQMGVELQQRLIIEKIEQELADRPEVCQVLVEKINYISKMAKAAMAAAVIDLEAQKIKNQF